MVFDTKLLASCLTVFLAANNYPRSYALRKHHLAYVTVDPFY